MEIRKFKRFGKQQEFVCLLNKEMDSLVDNYAKRRIADLEAKLAEYQNDGVGDAILNAGKKIKELEKQLAEKEKEIEELNHKLNVEQPCLLMNYKDMVDMLKKSQNQTAIEKLEKVKDKINAYKKEQCLLFVEWDVIEKAVEFIDQQIKSLKGDK